MNTEHDWLVWWHDEGSGMRPVNGQDHESHVRDMTRIAWLNGAFSFADEIERLRTQLEMWQDGNIMAESHRDEIERLTAERDEARREVCVLMQRTGFLRGDYAAERGWDCFKEANDERHC